jgi:hypothetical protein
MDLDPSYVSRVARGERQSEPVEAALEREMKRIVRLAGMSHHGATKKPAARKKNKKVIQ